jgi:hypothetical protein
MAGFVNSADVYSLFYGFFCIGCQCNSLLKAGNLATGGQIAQTKKGPSSNRRE